MAFIYSTDEIVAKRMYNTGVSKKSKISEFVNFGWYRETKQPNGYMTICSRLAVKACISDKAILGYDPETNELIIIPAIIGGNMDVTGVKNSNTRYIAGLKFLRAIGFTDQNLPLGRYEANIDNDGYIHVYLNRRLPEDEQPVYNGEAVYGAE